MSETTTLRQQLVELLQSRNAHLDFDAVARQVSPELRGKKPAGLPHSPWQLLEHMRICQWDILEYSRNPAHVSPPFPEGYWPRAEAPPTEAMWDRSVASFQADLKAMKDLILDEANDLIKPIPHGQGAHLLREVLLLADHNAYHLGQLVDVLRLLGGWEENAWNPLDQAQ